MQVPSINDRLEVHCCCSQGYVGGACTPRTLSKARGPAARLGWLLSRVARSRLTEGISRDSVEKVFYHYFECSGRQRCQEARCKVLAREGKRASADHTYHVVSNLAAQDENGRQVALKASLTSLMGQDYVLGCKVHRDHLRVATCWMLSLKNKTC